jgi:hypothetical protein
MTIGRDAGPHRPKQARESGFEDKNHDSNNGDVRKAMHLAKEESFCLIFANEIMEVLQSDFRAIPL